MVYSPSVSRNQILLCAFAIFIRQTAFVKLTVTAPPSPWPVNGDAFCDSKAIMSGGSWDIGVVTFFRSLARNICICGTQSLATEVGRFWFQLGRVILLFKTLIEG